MNSLPKILVIDDQLGRAYRERFSHRHDYCVRLGLKDITGDCTPGYVENPIAEAIFISGQVNKNGVVENDLPGTLRRIAEGWEQSPRWSLVLLDLHFKTGNITDDGEPIGRHQDSDPQKYFGIKILERLCLDQSLKDLPVVILSSMSRKEIEKLIADYGGWGFEEKHSLDQDKLEELIQCHGLIEDSDNIIIGRSVPLLLTLREARRRAQIRNDNILLMGETGTGKELLAKYIHKHSHRSGKFRLVYTQGVPETLIEDKLFGHKKGAYTGATTDEPGEAELADKGTLFIDEFGVIPASIQPKLLRLLDRNIRETQRIGSNDAKKLDLQVVLASNKFDILSSSNFQRDLLERIKVGYPIVLPPLRDRKEDIPILVNYFVRKIEKKLGTQKREIPDEVITALMEYSFPGNVRELETILERAISTYKDLQYFSPNHLHLSPRQSFVEVSQTIESENNNRNQVKLTSIQDEFLKHLLNGTYDNLTRDELEDKFMGKFPDLQRFIQKLLIDYIKTCKKAAQNPLRPEPSQVDIYRFMLGENSDELKNMKNTSNQVARKMVKLMRIFNVEYDDLLDDPEIRNLYKTAKKRGYSEK